MLFPIAPFNISGGRSVKESTNNWVSRLHQRTKQRADQLGVTLQEVLIGVAVAAVVAAGAILLGPRFIGQGQQAASRQTLQSAVTATESTYARIIPGGSQLWTGKEVSMPSGVTDSAAIQAQAAAVYTGVATVEFNKLGEAFTFIPVIRHAAYCDNSNEITPAGATALGLTAASKCVNDNDDIEGLDGNEVWVYVRDELDVPAGQHQGSAAVTIKGGKALILGISGSDGSTMCAINVKDSAPSTLIGRGYQAVNESVINTPAAVADCGVFQSAPDEWPGHDPQTNPSLGDPQDTAY